MGDIQRTTTKDVIILSCATTQGAASYGAMSTCGGLKILFMGKSDIICIQCKPKVCKFPLSSTPFFGNLQTSG